MKRATPDPRATSNMVFGIACVFMLGAIYGLLKSKPTPKSNRIASRQSEDAIARAKVDLRVAQAAVAEKTWVGDDAPITGKILGMVTTLAHKRNVDFVRLTPQRATLGTPLEQLPYLLVVEGKFPDVVALEKDLEVPANRLAVSAIQVASSDSETNKVSANLVIVAHRVGGDVGTTENKNVKGS